MKKGYKKLVEEAEAEVETLSVAEAHELLGREDTVVVDIRDVRELWREGKILGALHAPRGMLEFWVDPESPYYRPELGAADKKYLLYCRGGWRSVLAARDLQNMGMTNVAHIDGGFEAWKEAGFEIEPVKQKPPKAQTDDSQKPPLAAPLVHEFVGQAHGNLERVREMLVAEPRLINAAWDWSDGDFETGLGAAAHMGRRDIAEFLLENGARIDLPTAAMLGWLDVVKAIIEAQPEARHIPGAHGIPLIAHAKAGGEKAAAVVAFLEGFEG